MPIGNDLTSAFATIFFLMYFPLDTLPSIGFGESSGINQDPFSFIAPCILPFLHISFTERGETFHSKAFSLQVFIYISAPIIRNIIPHLTQIIPQQNAKSQINSIFCV